MHRRKQDIENKYNSGIWSGRPQRIETECPGSPTRNSVILPQTVLLLFIGLIQQTNTQQRNTTWGRRQEGKASLSQRNRSNSIPLCLSTAQQS